MRVVFGWALVEGIMTLGLGGFYYDYDGVGDIHHEV